MGPIDYSLQVQQPFQAAATGYQLGSAIRSDQLQQQQQQQALQDHQRALQAQQQMQDDLAAASRDHRLLPSVMVKYPQLADKLKHGWDAMNGDQQRNSLSDATEVYAALKSGRKDIAVKRLKDQAEALRNSGDEQGAKRLDDMSQWAEMDAQSFMDSTAMRIAALPGGDKVIEGVSKLGGEKRAEELHPSAVATAQAGAQLATTNAKFAQDKIVAELKLNQAQIEHLNADTEIGRMNARIAAMNASTARAGNDLKRQELQLKVDEAVRERDEKIRGKVAEVESAATAIDNSLNTIERIKKNPKLNNVLGSIEGRIPAMFNDEEADAVALIETLGSQAFLAQIPAMKGQGALSNAEGDKLQSALTNLSRVQGETQFRTNLDEAARLMNKARATLAKRAGVPLGKPDTPAAPGARPPLSSFGGG